MTNSSKHCFPRTIPNQKFKVSKIDPFKIYAQMVPTCSAEFVGRVLDCKDQSNPLYRNLPSRRLMTYHGELLRKRIVDALFGDGVRDDLLPEYLETFVYRNPPLPGLVPRTSASMEFAMKVLKLRLENIDDERWPSTISETKILLFLLKRSVKKTSSGGQIACYNHDGPSIYRGQTGTFSQTALANNHCPLGKVPHAVRRFSRTRSTPWARWQPKDNQL